jgi:outer membrane protein OmpA-like peptidoglycan-associated protein
LLTLLRERVGGFVEITGHTDATGGEELNGELGQERADRVRDFLSKPGSRPPRWRASARERAISSARTRRRPRG